MRNRETQERGLSVDFLCIVHVYVQGYDILERRERGNYCSGVPDMHETLSSFPEQFGDGPRKPEIKPEIRKDNPGRTADNLKCGWFWFRPIYLQRFRTAKWALFWLCWAGAMQGMVVNGFVNVVITTIERRFGLKSSETGLIAGGYDIASFLLLVPVSYLGGRAKASKPRYIGVGVLVLGIGSMLFASPHYLAGPYRGGQQTKNTCQAAANVSSHSISSCADQSTVQVELQPYSGLYLTIFLVAQLLHGAGAAPFYTLGVTFLDENVTKKMSSVYLGIYYTMAIIGPALGYVVGGELLKIYTDFITIDPSTIGLTPGSNIWVGAWWIGFLAAGVICFVIAIPILAFPAILPGSEELAKERVSEAHEKPTRSSTAATGEAFSKIRELPRALTELLGNPAFFMLNLAGASEGLLMAGFAAFLPKLIENQFSVSASSAAMLMDVRELQLHTRVADEPDARRRHRSVRGGQHHLREQVRLSVDIRRSGVLQHVLDFSLHHARALVHVASCARRSAFVRARHTVAQGPHTRNDTRPDGVWRSHRRHLHPVERDVRRQRSVSRVRQLLHEQIHARTGVYRQSSLAPLLLLGLVDVRATGRQSHRSEFPPADHGHLNAQRHVPGRSSGTKHDSVKLVCLFVCLFSFLLYREGF
ncbi:solute carrier organic anion transporter family member 4A1 isoform X6 [Pseudomyrmex gracilis]|uniref:solute carrier organic anion transporter family member 4A1 isoform X6 n=1 Tax=Pseudomyrmex gracilis TaxID=219809 RepID=UPI000995D516|nr:solute carrier organic anion transporter family member 4A1 isoform X6 [Pseudomyrmex gracilis]